MEVKNNEQEYTYSFKSDQLRAHEFQLSELPFFLLEKKVKVTDNLKFGIVDTDNGSVEAIPTVIDGEKRVLQEFDMKIFYGLVNLYFEDSSSETVKTDYFLLMKAAGINYNGASMMRTEESIELLQKVRIKAVWGENGENAEEFVLVEKIDVYDSEDVLNSEEPEMQSLKKYFRNSKIKKVLAVKINKKLLKSLVALKKLPIFEDMVTKRVYTLLENMRLKGMSGSFDLDFEFLSYFIPMMPSKNNIDKMERYFEEAFEEMEHEELIERFYIDLRRDYLNSSVRIFLSPYVDKEKEDEMVVNEAISKNDLEKLKKYLIEDIESFKRYSYELREISKRIDIKHSIVNQQIMPSVIKLIKKIGTMAKFMRRNDVARLANATEELMQECYAKRIKFDKHVVDIVRDSAGELTEIFRNRRKEGKEMNLVGKIQDIIDKARW